MKGSCDRETRPGLHQGLHSKLYRLWTVFATPFDPPWKESGNNVDEVEKRKHLQNRLVSAGVLSPIVFVEEE
jgi:hypothetical protein